MKKLLLCLPLFLVSCATTPQSASDLKVDESYALVGNPHEEVRTCRITVKNILTVVPTPIGLLPMKEANGAEALVCGPVACPADTKNEGTDFYCSSLKQLQEPQ